jgi:SagB-type dehydrogenase family enzyme
MVLTRLPIYVGTAEPPSMPGDRSHGSSADRDLSAEQVVVAYHERTKHHYHRSAASLGYMDWAKQPDPFRRYDGASLVHLPFPDAGRALPYWQLYVADNMVPVPLSVDSISLFFRYALSLTAWKRLQETTWSLRTPPSSGNLHPTEGYAFLPSLDGIHNRPGVYHYASKAHGLELRADLDPSVWAALTAAFPEGSFLVGLSSIHWREAWKYGERAFRYCQHDVGHALGTMRFAAATLGWKLPSPRSCGRRRCVTTSRTRPRGRLRWRGARASRTRGTCRPGEMGQLDSWSHVPDTAGKKGLLSLSN